jgi:predicted amidohydrolase
MRVGAWQFDVRRGDVDANLEEVERGVRAAAQEGVELLALPEMWPTSFVPYADEGDWVEASERAVEALAVLSRSSGVAICGSAFARGPSGALPRNRLHLVERGVLALAFDKVHLFSPTAETMAFSPGAEPPRTVELRGARVSGVVCYDLRFSPLLRAPFRDEAEILVVPAQWPDTRAAHWTALVTGRAVELQAYVLAANRTGRDEIGRRRLELGFPGNSLIAGPHGTIVARGRGEAGLVAAELDLEEVRALRRQVPVRSDDRQDLYATW